jgi:WD40 repeat protein/serine/threonine protein kinase
MIEPARDAEAIFLTALDKAIPQERAAFVAGACAGRPELLQRVQELLASHDASHGPLDAPPIHRWATIDLPPIAERPGMSIGPYKLLQQIGEGGMGVVYMAEQLEPVRRKVALKIIKPGMDSAQVIARFEAERQALAMMDHQNIARVLDAGTTESGRPYFVMELVHGVSITTFCDNSQLTPRERLELFIPVCQAIQHAHQKGIIHRDIKPSNVLVTMYDDKPVPKVIDFGVAKAVEQRLTDRTLFTQYGALVGTFEYMSPEQAEMNALGVDTRSDIYSLGVLLYELLTGTTPLEKTKVREAALNEVVRLIKEEEPPRPSIRLSNSGNLEKIAAARKMEPAHLAKLVRGELDWIVMKSLEKDRSRRYETANGMAQDIQRYLSDEPVQAGPPNAAYRLRKFVKRNRGPVVVAAVVAMTLVAGIIGTTWGWLDALQARKEEAEQRETAVKAISDARDAEAAKAQVEKAAREALQKEQGKTKDALALAEKRRVEADLRREQADTSALRIEFEHHFAKSEERPDLAVLSMANLLPKAASLKDLVMADSFRLHIGVWGARLPRLHAICSHQDSVLAVALSTDGKTALTGSWDKTARLWETATGKPIGPPLEHQRQIDAVALSADGTKALTASQDETARLWEATTGKPIGPPLQHQAQVLAVALSADGKTALTGSRDQTARLWEAATGKPIGPPLQHQFAVVAVTLSPDGKIALTGSADGTARLWATATGKPIGPPLRHKESISAVALSADGKTALTGSWDTTARLWETATGKPIGPPLQHDGWVAAVALSTDGKSALTGSWDWTARLWETATGKPIGPPLQHLGEVRTVALSADSKIALTGSRDKTARLWDTATGKPIAPPMQHQEAVWAVALSADGKTILTGSAAARLWEMPTVKPTGPVLQHQTEVTAVALGADGMTALTGCLGQTAQRWETATGKPIGPPLEPGGECGAMSADGKLGLILSSDTTVRLWNTVTGKAIGPPLQHQDMVTALSLNADGKTALTGSLDKMARVWDTATGKQIGSPLQHEGIVWSVALSPDGKTALTGSFDKTARLWEAATGKPVGEPLRHQDEVKAVALSADGTTVLNLQR